MLKWLVFSAAVLTWPLLSFGALVRLNGAGLSCPDWPLCYGKLVPPPGFEIAMEVGHRLVASLLGLMIIGIVALTYRNTENRQYRGLAVTALILVCIQGLLGGLTVTMVLWPPVVTFHLLGGNLLFGLLVYLSWLMFQKRKSPIAGSPDGPLSFPTGNSRIVFWMLILLLAIAASGGYNSATYSGYACEAFPGCHEGSWASFGLSGWEFGGTLLHPAPEELQGKFLPMFPNEWIHMLHRAFAIGGAAALMLMAWRRLLRQPARGSRFAGWAILMLVPLEIAVGVLNALLRVPVPVSALHTAITATLMGVLSYALAKALHEQRTVSSQEIVEPTSAEVLRATAVREKIPA